MNIARVLGHLQDIHDAPDDGRDFVAFEKRPQMLAAGVPPEAFDGFDFSSRPAVAREIGVLSGGEPMRPPEPSHSQTQDLVYRGEPVGLTKGYDGTGEQMMLAAFGGSRPPSAGPPTGRGGGLMYPRPTSERANIISGKVNGHIEAAPNPRANGKPPLVEIPEASMVGANEKHIASAAAKYGIDPDLLRAAVFMESTHGWYDAPLRPFNLDSSILPMNINTSYWSDTWGPRANLRDPRNNIDTGAKMRRNISKAMPTASVAQVGSVYHNSAAKQVDDYGARLQSIYESKPWLSPSWPYGAPAPLGD